MTISNFKGKYRFLSNFWMAEVEFEGLTYPSTEHAYQAAKTQEPEIREAIINLDTPAKTKKAAKLLTLPENWHTYKLGVMETLLREKFSRHSDLKQKLLATCDEDLVEGNTWHDTSWGVCSCKVCGNQGDNHLGKLLMQIRSELNATG